MLICSIRVGWNVFQRAPWRFSALTAVGSIGFVGLGFLSRWLQRPEVGAEGNLLLLALLALLLGLSIPPLTMALLMRLGDSLLDPDSQRPPAGQAIRGALLVPLLQGLLLAGLALIAMGGWALIQPFSDFAGLILVAAVGLFLLEQLVTQLFAMPMVVLTRRGAGEAIRCSHRALAAHRLEASMLLLIMLGLTAAGVVVGCGGVVITLPIAVLIQISCFRCWQRRHTRS